MTTLIIFMYASGSYRLFKEEKCASTFVEFFWNLINKIKMNQIILSNVFCQFF